MCPGKQKSKWLFATNFEARNNKLYKFFSFILPKCNFLKYHMSHNCTARNCLFLGLSRCRALHFSSKILRSIGHTDGNIPAEWCGRFPFSLGIPEVCLPKLVGKHFQCSEVTPPMIASDFRKQCFRTSLPMSGALLPMNGCRHTQHCLQKAVGKGMDHPGPLLPNTAPQSHGI